MSAITGIFYRNGRSVDPELIRKMNNKLSHRGPDGSSTWCEGSVAFGHQMLFTTAESLHEKLPFEDEDSGLVITADARIDNRKELSELLELEDTEEVSDSLFIIKAYEKWGEDCPDKLLGDFAFAIWDKNNEKLFCARDHMGVKPFYYYLSDELFIFASEIKAIFSIPNMYQQINELEVAYFLSLIAGEDRKLTIYNGIFRLPAAHSLSLVFKNHVLNQYWSLNLDLKIRFDSDEEYEKAFLDLFINVVRCRLRTSFPVGSMLSGGLDSSSVACIAQKILQDEERNDLKTFSAFFDTVPESNERYFIEKVLAYYEFESYVVNADKISPLKEINNFFFYTDQPLIVPNAFMIWNIIHKASLNDVRILLDGFEGDATVSHGKGFLTELFLTKRWKKLFFEIIDSKRLGKNIYKINIEIGFNILPLFIKRKIKLYREFKGKRGPKTKILKKDFADNNHLMERVMEIYEESFKIDNAHEQHYSMLTSGLLQSEMELLDSLSAPFSIELRHPFFDKRLVEFCLAIPTEQKISHGWTRSIMRRAMSGYIPKEIQWRKDKGNLSFNFKKSLMKEHMFLDEILKETKSIEGFVEIEKVQDIYNQCKSGDIKYVLYIWNTVLLSLWLKETGLNKEIEGVL